MPQLDELTVNVRSRKKATFDSKHLTAEGSKRRTESPMHTSLLHRNNAGLTWKNSSLNTGTGQKVRRAGNRPSREGAGESMAKSDQVRASKKAARKTAARASGNGHDVALQKGKLVTRRSRRREPARIVLPEGYRPSESEPFMNERHKIYFRNKLVAWKEEIVRQNRETLLQLHEDSAQHADFADRATSETDRALELRARDRQRKLIAKIDAALARIEDGSYGYCEETGEPIGLRRLDARPIATLSLEAQERHERREKVFRED
jgi:DnaK suppressor protein